ncbi:unnamed protein product [Prunus armeniaca]
MNPTSSTLTQPQVKIKTKGRSKVDTSTRHLPSAFEVVLFGQDSAHSTDNVVTRPPRKKSKTIPQKRSVCNSQTQPLPYVNSKKSPSKLLVNDSCLTPEFNKWFPKHMLIHIRGAQDAKRNGNCGFRAIGSLMGFGDNAWGKVYLEGQHPMPPVDGHWLRCATITASDWLMPYQDPIRHFRYEAGVADPYDNDPIFIE